MPPDLGPSLRLRPQLPARFPAAALRTRWVFGGNVIASRRASPPVAVSCNRPSPAVIRVQPSTHRGMVLGMIPRAKVEELVKAHAELDEPTTNAIWIKPEAPEVWLVEIIPAMTDDDKAEEPTYFNAGIAFRFPLALISGNRASLEAALRRSPELARDVAKGTVMLDDGGAQALVELAREVSRAA